MGERPRPDAVPCVETLKLPQGALAAAAALPVHFARLERVAATLAALTFAVAVMIDKVR